MEISEYDRTRRIMFPVFGAYRVMTPGAITQPGDLLVLVGVVARWSNELLFVQAKLEFKLYRDGMNAQDIEMNAKTATVRIEDGAYVGLPGTTLPRLSLLSSLQPDAPEFLELTEGRDLWETINGRKHPERLRYHAQQYERVKKGDNFRYAVIYTDPSKEELKPFQRSK